MTKVKLLPKARLRQTVRRVLGNSTRILAPRIMFPQANVTTIAGYVVFSFESVSPYSLFAAKNIPIK